MITITTPNELLKTLALKGFEDEQTQDEINKHVINTLENGWEGKKCNI